MQYSQTGMDKLPCRKYVANNEEFSSSGCVIVHCSEQQELSVLPPLCENEKCLESCQNHIMQKCCHMSAFKTGGATPMFFVVVFRAPVQPCLLILSSSDALLLGDTRYASVTSQHLIGSTQPIVDKIRGKVSLLNHRL